MGSVQIFQTRPIVNEFGRVGNAMKKRLSDTFLTRPIGRVVNAPKRTRFWRVRQCAVPQICRSKPRPQMHWLFGHREGNEGRAPSKWHGSDSDASKSDADEQKREGNGGRTPSKRDGSESDASKSDADEQKVKESTKGRE
eukprot:gene18950-biopygen17454